MRPIVFVKYFDKGSTVLGAHQMEAKLTERGLEARTLYARELGEVRDSILVFIKKGQIHHLLAARRRGNLAVLDVQDRLCFKKRLKNRRLFDGVIFRSQKPLDDYGDGDPFAVKIYLQCNPHFQPNTVGDAEFKLGYIGDPRSFEFWESLPDVPCVAEDRFFEGARAFNCHISVRTTPRDFLYKPTCKVSTAAACEANLITTRDEATLEVLGPDYPYSTEPDRDSIVAAIDRARESFGSPAWHAGLQAMRRVRESHDLDRITDEYLDYFGRLDAAHPVASA